MDALKRERKTAKEQRLTSPLDEILKRLEHLERRMARLEAAMGAGRPAPQASSAEAFRNATPRTETSAPASAATPESRISPSVSPIGAPSPASAAVRTSMPAAPGAAPSTSQPAPADAPATLRLPPTPAKGYDGADAFPDLSQLDEKVERKKGPAELIDVRASLEDYPRISTRIQQLWGSPECEAYLNNLVIDTRGNRKGFPPAMMEELLYLGRLARVLVILGIGGDMWDAYEHVGDRR